MPSYDEVTISIRGHGGIELSRSPWRIAILFAVEAITCVLVLFESREIVRFFYRNVLVAYLLLALYLEGLRAPWHYARRRSA